MDDDESSVLQSTVTNPVSNTISQLAKIKTETEYTGEKPNALGINSVAQQTVQESSQDGTPPDQASNFVQQRRSSDLCNKTTLGAAMNSSVMDSDDVTIKEEDSDALFMEIATELGLFNDSDDISEATGTDEQQQVDDAACLYGTNSSDQTCRNSISHNEVTPEKSYLCDICHKTFKYPSHLTRHQNSHTGTKQFTCEICGKAFSETGNLNKHKQRSHGAFKPFICDTCNWSFSNASSLDKHKLVHSGIKQFMCDICGKKFRYDNNLKVHKQSHNSVKWFGCDVCKKTFGQQRYLVAHKRIHSGTRSQNPGSEFVCNTALADKDNCKQQPHQNTAHPVACYTTVANKLTPVSVSSSFREQPDQTDISLYMSVVCDDFEQESYQSNASSNVSHSNSMNTEHVDIKVEEEDDDGEAIFTEITNHLYAAGHHSDGPEMLRGTGVQEQIDATICAYKSNSSDNIYQNFSPHEAHTSEKSLECDVCHKTFKRHSYLNTHKLLHTASGDKPYVCDICKKAFSRASSLNRHSSTHSGIKPFACDICQKAFHERGNLLKHKRSHCNMKSYTCDICSKVFKNLHKLEFHKLSHDSGIKIYMCNICDKEFRCTSHLHAHKATHTGVKPYVCDVCNKAFGSVSDLIRHGYVHSGIKPFSCNICQKAYSDRSNLFKHKRTHSGFKPFVCTMCNWSFTSASGLDKHKLVHSGIKQFMCDICGSKFKYDNNLKVHKRTHNSVKRFDCNVCNRLFRQRRYLVAHKRIHSRTELQNASSEFVQSMALAEIAEKLKYVNDNCDQQQPDDRDVPPNVSHSSVTSLYRPTSGMFKAANNQQTIDPTGNIENTEQQNELTDAMDNQNSKGVSVKETAGAMFSAQLCVASLEMSCSTDAQKEDVDALCNTTGSGIVENEEVNAGQEKDNSSTHQNAHTAKKSHKCNICHRSFKYLQHLNTHKLIHTGAKPYTCDLCHKAFTSASDLNRHSYVHSGLKPFACDICQKAFSDRGNLLKHQRTHTCIESYTCAICSTVFDNFNKFEFHKLTHDSGIKTYMCGICHKEFKTSSHLSEHKSIHTGVKPHVCNVCDKAFRLVSSLNRHKVVHMSSKPFTCNVCNKTYGSKQYLARHKCTERSE